MYWALRAPSVLVTPWWLAVVWLWWALSAVSFKLFKRMIWYLVLEPLSSPICDIILDVGTPAGPTGPKVSAQCGYKEKHLSTLPSNPILASLNRATTLRLVSSLCWPSRFSRVQDSSNWMVTHLESGCLGGECSVLADKNSVSPCLSKGIFVCSVINPSDCTCKSSVWTATCLPSHVLNLLPIFTRFLNTTTSSSWHSICIPMKWTLSILNLIASVRTCVKITRRRCVIGCV